MTKIIDELESFIPFYDNILIVKDDKEKVTASNIVIVDTGASKSYAEGIAVTVGEGFRLQDGGIKPLKVKSGDMLIYRKGSEISITLSNKTYFVISEANVIGIKGNING